MRSTLFPDASLKYALVSAALPASLVSKKQPIPASFRALAATDDGVFGSGHEHTFTQ